MAKEPSNWLFILVAIIFVFAAVIVGQLTGTDEKLLYLIMISTAIFCQTAQR